MQVGAHILVSGYVQGVGYRYFVYRQATKLGLPGYVRNTWGGDVEVEVEGDRSLIEELIKEIKVGPRSAEVTDLRISWLEFQNRFQLFEVRY